MNPKIRYLLELSKLIGRLGYALEADDTKAFCGILELIKDLTAKAIIANRVRIPMRVVDIFDGIDDDEL